MVGLQTEAFNGQDSTAAKRVQTDPAQEHNPIKRFFKVLGPGVITGASDDDPSDIGTYSMAGASFGYAPHWTALVNFPLMVADFNSVVQITRNEVAIELGRYTPTRSSDGPSLFRIGEQFDSVSTCALLTGGAICRLRTFNERTLWPAAAAGVEVPHERIDESAEAEFGHLADV